MTQCDYDWLWNLSSSSTFIYQHCNKRLSMLTG